MSRRTEIRDQRMRRRRRTTAIAVLAIIGVALITTAFLIAQNNRPVGAIATPAPRAYGQTDGQSIGDPNAPVKIEEFSDFQCPYCRVFHEETFPQILRDYVRDRQGVLHLPQLPDRRRPERDEGIDQRRQGQRVRRAAGQVL